ncbi:MAG: biotin--[acetyl-CoA-carboxylase] ligase [Desulfobulbaceae bacterium]|nr:biotin--[acetyl-CoA-carboxylase] ligase [Desulfobulbaceae bacterium]
MDPFDGDPIWQRIKQAGHLEERRVHSLQTVESTNSLALEMGRAGEKSGTVWVAETQTKGRGRLGKCWESPAGAGLYCTVLLRPAIALPQLARVTLAAGLATALAIDEVSGLASRIKWPNDVLIAGQKVAGILVECHMAVGEEPLVALGVGINLQTSLEQFPGELRSRATSLLMASGRAIGKGVMLATLLRRIETVIARLEKNDFSGILGEWRARDATMNKTLTWVTIDGQIVHGLSLGPDEDGLLVIRDQSGKHHHVLSGDLTLDPSTRDGYFP